MKKEVTLLLLTLLCLGLAAVPAMASGFQFSTGAPETPSPVGFGPFGPPMGTNPIPSVSWTCAFAHGCDVTQINYWEFDNLGAQPLPTLLNEVVLTNAPFNFGTPFAEFSAPIHQTSCSNFGTTVTWCFESIVFANAGISPVHVPQGTSFITLYGENITSPNDTFWSNSGSTSIISTTESQDPVTGVITGFPSQLAFSVQGTAVPEPSSIMLLGSGVLGLVGVLRRKLMR